MRFVLLSGMCYLSGAAGFPAGGSGPYAVHKRQEQRYSTRKEEQCRSQNTQSITQNI